MHVPSSDQRDSTPSGLHTPIVIAGSSPVRHTLLSRNRAALASFLLPFIGACSGGVLDPQGPVSGAERVILLDSVAIMLVVVAPTILVTFAVAFWFRASNARAKHLPNWAYSGRLEFIVWAIPALIVMFLGGIAWIGAHDLDPYKPIAAKAAPLEIEVVSLDWKWLFIYPQQGIASVNELTIPESTPIHFRLTSGTVMNSFFVPQLGSQIYTMAGMTSQLSLLADRQGDYRGQSTQFSGDGFADMHFDVRAVSESDFSAWVAKTRGTAGTLDETAYDKLLRPGVEPKAFTYGSVGPGIFQAILNQSTTDARAPSADQPRPAVPSKPES